MATISKKRERSVGYCRATGTMTITEGSKATRYAVAEFPADFGVAYAVVKLDESGEPVERYSANIDPRHEACSCIAGLLGRARCRHVAGLLALRAAGRL